MLLKICILPLIVTQQKNILPYSLRWKVHIAVETPPLTNPVQTLVTSLKSYPYHISALEPNIRNIARYVIVCTFDCQTHNLLRREGVQYFSNTSFICFEFPESVTLPSRAGSWQVEANGWVRHGSCNNTGITYNAVLTGGACWNNQNTNCHNRVNISKALNWRRLSVHP